MGGEVPEGVEGDQNGWSSGLWTEFHHRGSGTPQLEKEGGSSGL